MAKRELFANYHGKFYRKYKTTVTKKLVYNFYQILWSKNFG